MYAIERIDTYCCMFKMLATGPRVAREHCVFFGGGEKMLLLLSSSRPPVADEGEVKTNLYS